MKFKKFIKYGLLVVFITFLAFLYNFSTHKNKQRKIIDPVVEFIEGDANFLTHSMVNKLLIQNQKQLKNQAKSVIDLYRLESGLLTNPYVEKTVVFLTIGGTLKTKIKQRTAIARIITNNSSYYIDKQGFVMPLSVNYSARVPLVTGLKNKTDLKDIIKVMQQILKDDFLHKEIVGIHKFDKNNYEFSVRSGNYKIIFGKPERINIKFKKLKAFYSKVLLDEKKETYKTINLKYHNQVVCTK